MLAAEAWSPRLARLSPTTIIGLPSCGDTGANVKAAKPELSGANLCELYAISGAHMTMSLV